RHLRGGNRRGPRRGRGSRQRFVRGAGRREARGFDAVRPHHRVRRNPRPGRSGRVLRRIRAALAPGGTFLMLDVCASSELADNVGLPMAPYLYTMSTMHCMSVSLAAGGPGLGTAWGHQLATRMLREAGFPDVQLFERIDPANSLYVARSSR